MKYGRGDVIIVRYADDFVLGFEHHFDARRFQQEFREREIKLELRRRLHASVAELGNGWVRFYADTVYQPISRRSMRSGPRSLDVGDVRFGGVVIGDDSTGIVCSAWQHAGFHLAPLFILGPRLALTFGPAIRVECGNSARWDLCGGGSSLRAKSRPYRDRSNGLTWGSDPSSRAVVLSTWTPEPDLMLRWPSA